MGQDLIDLLQAGRYFEAKSLYDTIRIKVDSIHPFIECFYKGYMSGYENKPDSVAFYLEEMIKKRFFPDILYMKVYGIYVEQLQDYKKAEQTLDRVRSYLEHNPDSINAEEMKVVCDHLADSESRTMRQAAEPTIRIVRDDTGSSTPLLADKILNDNYLFCNVSYNGHQPIRTLFDTGVSEYLIMDKTIAEQVGVRKYPVYENDTTCTVNGMKVPGYLGILDSLQIGDIKLYHIPVEVIDAKSIIHLSDTLAMTSCEKEDITHSFYELMKVSLGLNTMSLIGRIVIEPTNNRLSFPKEPEVQEATKNKNMFRCEGRLFTQCKLNDIFVTTAIDTKSNDYIRIDRCLYEKHEPFIPVDTLKEKKYNYQTVISGAPLDTFNVIARDPVVTFHDQVILLKEEDHVCISSLTRWGKTYPEMVESVIGFPFLKRLGKKILFDFRNMRMEALE